MTKGWIFAAIALFAAGAAFAPRAQAAQSLESAVRECAEHLRGRFPRGTRAAVIATRGDSRELGEFVQRALSEALVNAGWFTVVERDAAAQDMIARELYRHLRFYVSQETELAVGRQLGAEIIVSGTLTRAGQNWRLDVRAVTVEGAQLAAQWSAANVRPDPSWAALASPGVAGLAFVGDALSARDMATVAVGLRNAMQSRGLSLSLDENAAGAGYVFTVTVFSERLPPAPPANAALLRVEATVAFSRGGRVLVQGGPYRVTEMTEAMAMRRVAEGIAADGAFFDRVNQATR